VTPHAVRALWVRAETIHAVTYLADESRAAARDLGLRGFWMGYFAFRAAPLGPVDADVVEAAFYNFAPAMVRRAIPDAWRYAAPEAIVVRRSESAAAALRRLANAAEIDPAVAGAPSLRAASTSVTADERSLFGANRVLTQPDDPVAALWQATTTLREHRGDAHVAALRAAGISGCQAHLLLAAERGVPDDVLRENRGWTHDEWNGERRRLVARGLLEDAGALSSAGRDVRESVEAATDAGAQELVASLDVDELIAAFDPLARRVAGSGTIPFPNPMGLPSLDAS